MNFIVLRAYDNYIYAHIRMGMLRSAGINCHLKDELTVTTDPLLSPALGGIKIMVEASQALEADQLLRETEEKG
jgi:hypothetical protein